MVLWEASPLYTALTGEKMPLEIGEYLSHGENAYIDQAIIMALNEAYAQSLAGRQ